MAISDPGRGLVRRLGVTAAALLAFAAASQQRAEALSLASPGTAPSAKFATGDLTTEVRHGGRSGETCCVIPLDTESLYSDATNPSA